MSKKIKSYSPLILLILISLIPLFDFFKPGFPSTHDGRDHVVRIANFYESLKEGNLIPRWAKNLNWRYGTPVLLFFYPLPSYLGSLFHFLGFSFIDSTKIVFGLGFVLSGVFMYLWIKEIWGKKAGFAAALVYLFAPYRFVDLYVRGAIGECTAFIWPPLICWLLLKFSKKQLWQYFLGGSLSIAALILSHNALSIMFLAIIFGYLGLLIYSTPPQTRLLLVICYLLLVILGFALSAFFWFPALFEAKYTLRDIVMAGTFGGFEPLKRLVWSPWQYGGTGIFSVQLGLVQWLIVLTAPFLIWHSLKEKNKQALFLTYFFLVFLFSLFIILPSSRFIYQKITLLKKFQFAWRFLSLAIFPPAIFAGAFVKFLPKSSKLPLLSGFIIALLLLNKNYWHPKDFLFYPDEFYSQFQEGTTNDTGESAPRWSIRFMEKFPQAPMEVIDGDAAIKEVERLGNLHLYQVKANQRTRLVENTLYFPGWQIFVDAQAVPIEFQDPSQRGLMTFWVEEGSHQILVQFGETRLRLFADLLSLFSLTLLVLFCIFFSPLLFFTNRNITRIKNKFTTILQSIVVK